MALNAPLDVRYAPPEPPLQLDRILDFQRRIFFQMSAALAGLAAGLGDRLGLFQAMAGRGPLTADELAAQQGTCPAMTSEWLRVMACAGIVRHVADGDRYLLPPEHAATLTHDGPMCVAGGLQQLVAFARQFTDVADAFRAGGGVAQAAYSSDLRDGMERLSATWFEHEMVDSWIGGLPDLANRLTAGATVAEAGCGGGRALIRLAQAFPQSRFVGYDLLPAAIERARRNAAKAGVADRATFEIRDVGNGLDGAHDLVLAFDSLHDMADPGQALAGLARGLAETGTLMVLELLSGDDDDEVGPIGVVLHATRLFYNLPVALAVSAEDRGRPGFSEADMRAMARRAGLVIERTPPVRNPLHGLYVLRRQGG